MDLTQIFVFGLSLGFAVLGWFARELWSAVQALRRDLSALEQALRRDLSALEVRVSTEYVRYDRLQDALKPILDGLQEIKQTLQHKADKP